VESPADIDDMFEEQRTRVFLERIACDCLDKVLDAEIQGEQSRFTLTGADPSASTPPPRRPPPGRMEPAGTAGRTLSGMAALEADAFGQLLGMELVEVDDGRALVTLQAGERHTNFLGLVHGGAVFSLADAALAAASNSDPDQSGRRNTAVASVVTIHLLRACHPGDRLLAQAVPEHRGGRLGLYRITVVRLPDQELVAVAEGQVVISGQG
jgi:acyl-CoA thioesterase